MKKTVVFICSIIMLVIIGGAIFSYISNIDKDGYEQYESYNFIDSSSNNVLNTYVDGNKTINTIEWPEIKLNGEYVLYYNNGQTAIKMNFNNGILDGEQFVYYENGQLYRENFYENGVKNGEEINYFEDGQIMQKLFYKDGLLDGEQFDYTCQSTAFINSWICDKINNYKDGKLDGEQIAYYQNGNIASKRFSKTGEFDGEWINYYENGQIEEKGNYKDGKLDGKQIAYYQDGKLKWERYYKDGEMRGLQTFYHENNDIGLYNYASGVWNILEFNEEGYLYFSRNISGYDNLILPDTVIDDKGSLVILDYYQEGLKFIIGYSGTDKIECIFHGSYYFTENKDDYLCNIFNENDEFKFIDEISFRTIISSFISSTTPDNAEILTQNEINLGEETDLKITILKDNSKINNYQGVIIIFITEEDGTPLKESEFTLTSNGIYIFQGSDLGEKEFKKGLTINKEGKFYIEVQDLGYNEDKILGKQLITVVKSS